jgi:hypothetical protein
MRRSAHILGWAALSIVLLAGLPAHAQPQQPLAPPPEPPPPAASADPAAPAPSPPPADAPSASPAPPPPPPAQAPAPAPPPPSYPTYPAYPYAYPYAYPPQPYGYPPAPYGYPPQPYANPAPAPAGAPPAGGSPAAAVVARSEPPPPTARREHAGDPQADRGVLLPTAYTHPKGTYFVSSYDLVFLQLGTALTDDTQLSLTTIPPLGQERVAFIDLTLKTSLYRGGLVRVAALGSTSGIVAPELGVLGVGRAGGVIQVCLERTCGSSLSMSTNVTLAGIMLMVNGVSGIFRMGRTLSLLAELDSLVPLARDAGAFGGSMAGGGLRWHWSHVGLDVTLMHVIGSTSGGTLPLIALTYRTN